MYFIRNNKNMINREIRYVGMNKHKSNLKNRKMALVDHRAIQPDLISESFYYAAVGTHTTELTHSILHFNFSDRTLTVYPENSFHTPDGPTSEEILFSMFDCAYIMRSGEVSIIKVEFYSTRNMYIRANNVSDHNTLYTIFRALTRSIRTLFKKDFLALDWRQKIRVFDCTFRGRTDPLEFTIYNGVVTVSYKRCAIPCIIIPMDSTVTISRRNSLHITSNLKKVLLVLSPDDLQEAFKLLSNCRHRVVPPPRVVNDMNAGRLSELSSYAMQLVEEDELYPEECLEHFDELCEVLKYIGKKKYATRQQKVDYMNEKYQKKEKLDDPPKEYPEDDLMQYVTSSNPFLELRRLESVGKGGFGEVFKAQMKSDGRFVALKVLKHSISERYTKIGQEIARMATWKNEYLIGIEKCWLYENRVYIVMPMCNAGSVKTVVKNKDHVFALCDVAYVIGSVLNGLAYIHERGFIHRDIKPANILMNENGGVKLIDFGLVTRVESKPHTRSGSKQYMAPEVILQKEYDEKVDIWSIGCVTQELAEGKSPYREDGIVKLLFRTVTNGAMGLRRIKYWDNVFIDFVSQCFYYKPEQRLSAKELLAHPFIGWATTSYFYKKYHNLPQ
ncbi:serine/threonine protein kinase, putative [Entamoeba invadens IP1]|uniref:serine/threonine protein kinase, putative n=1 Tax=Entamoeba invadens IP1 TaxID=370355 RepID=UPI0002C3D7F5|nr:serine/threonine protein kinase, putative [Entamoeba invadens IP1]ELP94244.1 serine/threonine protein kinase, putative [Entamoeba invadens IP1]|eukprot:XP_004261015.1 serine/threonine protein kinase, putative [Entamoeba invadens IP1]